MHIAGIHTRKKRIAYYVTYIVPYMYYTAQEKTVTVLQCLSFVSRKIYSFVVDN